LSAIVPEATSLLHASSRASRGRSGANDNRPAEPFSQLLGSTGPAVEGAAPAQVASQPARAESPAPDDKAAPKPIGTSAQSAKPRSADEAKKADQAPSALASTIASDTPETPTERALPIAPNPDIAGSNAALLLPENAVSAVEPADQPADCRLPAAPPPGPPTSAEGVGVAVIPVVETATAASSGTTAPPPMTMASVADTGGSSSAGESAEGSQPPAMIDGPAPQPKPEMPIKSDVTAARAREAVTSHGATQALEASAAHQPSGRQAIGVAGETADGPAGPAVSGQDKGAARVAPEPPSNPNPPPALQPLSGSVTTSSTPPPVTGVGIASAAPPFTSAGMPHPAQAPTAVPVVPVAGLAIEIAARAQAGNNRFEIRLDPPELGRIDVRLDVDRDGNVKSRLIVERAETLDLLRRDAPNLERALQQAGLKTSDNGLQFSLRDQAFSGRGDAEQAQAPTMAQLIVPDDGIVSGTQRDYARHAGLGNGVDIRV
jgi:flagellar hook-length control protein FliK